MNNPMEILKYQPQEGDIIMSLEGDHKVVTRSESTHVWFKGTDGEEYPTGKPIAKVRSDLISGKIFLIRRENEQPK